MYKVIIRCSSAFGICEEKDGQTLEQVRNLIDQWGDYDTVSYSKVTADQIAALKKNMEKAGKMDFQKYSQALGRQRW